MAKSGDKSGEKSVERKRRSYDQFCSVARALDVVSERWTLLIVRNLMLGPRRYSDLMTELPGITTNLLAARLQTMEADGVIARRDGRPARYELTALGAALEPVVVELGRWGANFMDQPRRRDRKARRKQRPMPIRAKCPGCQKVLAVKDHLAGRVIHVLQ